MRKSALRIHPLISLTRGSITFSLMLFIIIAGSILLVGGLTPRNSSNNNAPTGEVLVPDSSSLNPGKKSSLQLKTLPFKKVSPTEAPQECLDSAAVTLQLDVSSSMAEAIDDLKNAVYTFTNNLSDESIIGIQAFSYPDSRREVIRVSYYRDVKNQIQNRVGSLRAEGSTPTYDALNFSKEVLERAISDFPGRKFSFIFFSDGNPTVGPKDVTSISQAASGIKNLGVTVYAIGLGEINRQIIEAVASSPDKALYTTNSKDLERLYSEIKTQLCQ